eukprot:COSAG05_NODE_1810_length_4040_cov_11.771885_2_plen_410_part_00
MRVPKATALAAAAEAGRVRQQRDSVSLAEPAGATTTRRAQPHTLTTSRGTVPRTAHRRCSTYALRVALLMLVPVLACLPILWVAPLDTTAPLSRCTVNTDGFDFLVHGVLGLSLLWAAAIRRLADAQVGGLPRSNLVWAFDVAQPVCGLAGLHISNTYLSVAFDDESRAVQEPGQPSSQCTWFTLHYALDLAVTLPLAFVLRVAVLEHPTDLGCAPGDYGAGTTGGHQQRRGRGLCGITGRGLRALWQVLGVLACVFAAKLLVALTAHYALPVFRELGEIAFLTPGNATIKGGGWWFSSQGSGPTRRPGVAAAPVVKPETRLCARMGTLLALLGLPLLPSTLVLPPPPSLLLPPKHLWSNATIVPALSAFSAFFSSLAVSANEDDGKEDVPFAIASTLWACAPGAWLGC